MEVIQKKDGNITTSKIAFSPISFVDNDKELEEAAERENKINAERYINNSGIPEKYRKVKLNELTYDNIVYGPENKPFTFSFVDQMINDIADGKSRFLWLCGKPGTGKTTLAAAIIKELCKRQKSCKYYKSHEVMQRLEDSKRYSSKENVQMVVNDVTSTSFVVFDEIGRWPVTEWEKFRIFEFTNKLYEEYKSAIFISNMTKVELRNFMGKAAVDRFLEGGTTVDFQGNSFRGTDKELYTRR